MTTSPTKKQKTAQVPKLSRPSRPTQEVIDKGLAPPLLTYITELIPYVNQEVHEYLVSAGKNPPEKLCMLKPLDIVKEAGTDMKSFKEPFQNERCVNSLKSTQIHETCISGWWFDPLAHTWIEVDIGGMDSTWADFDAALRLWSEERFKASSDVPSFRRFIFPGALPSAVRSVVDVERAKVNGVLQNLPVVAGRLVLWSWFGAVDAALESKQPDVVGKLVEAMLTVTVRLRSTTTAEMCIMDSLSYSEVLRVSNLAGGASVFDFVATLSRIPNLSEAKCPTVPAFLAAATRLGATFEGQALTKSSCTAFKAIYPFAADRDVLKVFKEMDRFGSCLNDQTKLMRICQTVKKECPNTANEVMCFVLKTLKLALLCGDACEDDVKVHWLVGVQAELYLNNCFYV